MGGFGSGRYGGRPTVESAVRLDIDDMMQWGGIRAFARLAGEMRFNFYGDQIEVKFESRVGEPWESWLRLKYAMADYWTGEEVEIDDKIFLATTQPLGGLRWWFVCPHLNRRVRKLYLRLRLGSDPADDEYPDKPPRMRWATYNRLMDRLVAADAVTDEWLKAARAIVDQGRP